MRRRAIERVLHAVDVHAAGTEPGGGPGRGADRVTAHENVHPFERSRVEHDRLRVRRHHLFAWRAENDDGARRFRARQEFGNGNRGGDPDGTLRGVLVAVERPFGPAQRVVLEDDAEVRAWGRLVVARHERRLEIPDAHGHVEVMLLEIVR
jgi:hypothetical protein